MTLSLLQSALERIAEWAVRINTTNRARDATIAALDARIAALESKDQTHG